MLNGDSRYEDEFIATPKLDLFEEDITSYNLYELSNWIYRCNHHITLENTPKEELFDRVDEFCRKWREHRDTHKKFYESEIYKKAMLGSRYKRPVIIMKNGKLKNDVSDFVYPDTMAWVGSFPTTSITEFEEMLKNNIITSIDEYEALAEDCVGSSGDYKAKLDCMIKHICKTDRIIINSAELPKGKDYETLTNDEILDLFKKVKLPKNRQFMLKSIYTSIEEHFLETQISKSSYYAWKNPKTEERDFDKKFFVNLGLMLGLDMETMETLLSYNGYCLAGSIRIFDKFVIGAFMTGYSLFYTQILIEKENTERRYTSGKIAECIPSLYKKTELGKYKLRQDKKRHKQNI